ncbi:MAG TPA: hypothetical protein VE974_04815 [Thermoanaerobaculia bacterium]|nr:hypothetical protein [Thermoanaerobaculia bacterium]
MTKQELVTRLTRDPITVQQIATLAYYRIALHDDPDPSGGVWIGLERIAGPLLVDDYEQVYARVNGKVVRLRCHETEAVVSRLQQFFMRGGLSTRSPLARRHVRKNARPMTARLSTQYSLDAVAQERRAGGSASGGRT